MSRAVARGDLKVSGAGYTLLPRSVHPDGATYSFARGGRDGVVHATQLTDESRKAWLVRAAVSKTKSPRWIGLPDDLYEVVLDRLPAREDRDTAAPLFQ